MKAHRPTARSKSESRGRAKALFKEGLWWLRGFPLAEASRGQVLWLRVPEPGSAGPIEEVTVDRELLRRATSAAVKLWRAYPRALRHLVGDSRLWYAAVTGSIGLLKDAIHRAAPLPGVRSLLEMTELRPEEKRRALQWLDAHAAMAPVLRASLWIHFESTAELRRMLHWLERRAQNLMALLGSFPGRSGLDLLLCLADLTLADGENRVARLFELLCDRRAFEAPLVPAGDEEESIPDYLRWRIEARSSTKKKNHGPVAPPALPDAHLGPELAAWTQRLARLDPAARRRKLRLLELVLPSQTLDLWADWWAEARPLLREALDLLNQSPAAGLAARDIQGVSDKVVCLERNAPPAYPPPARVLEAVDQLALPAKKTVYDQVAATLPFLPEIHGGRLARVAFLLHWDSLATEFPGKQGLLSHLIASLRGVLRGRRVSLAVLALWQRTPCGEISWPSPDASFMSGRLKSWLAVEVYRAVEILYPARPGGETDGGIAEREAWSLLEGLTRLTKNGAQAARLFRGLRAKKLVEEASDMQVAALEAALVTSEGDTDVFVALLEIMAKADWDHRSASNLLLLARFVQEKEVLAEMLLHEDHARLATVALHLGCLNAAGAAGSVRLTRPGGPKGSKARGSVGTPGSKRWFDRYPPPLRPLLKRLASVDPRGRSAAARILGQNFPDPLRLEREIKTLRELLAADGDGGQARPLPSKAEALAARLQNLTSCAGRAPQVSADRLSRLKEKIRHRIRLAILARWDEALKLLLRERLGGIVGFSLPEAWLDDDRILDLMSELVKLPASFKDLAIRILKRRLGPPPWDLRDAPANAAFLERLQGLGVDPRPWLEGLEPREMKTSEARTVVLRLESDPLEVLFMGEYFKTCLSPGEFNFFSAVTNTADINKRVLFARDREGRVVGRCLLALTREGRILTFQPYCHDNALRFAAFVAGFARELAARMGAVCAARGKVEVLEAQDWYDDGPRDLTGRFEFLEDGSAFRGQLLTLAPEELPACLFSALKPDRLDAHTLPLILHLREFSARPELVVPLLPQILSAPGLSLSCLLRAQCLLRAAGETGGARRILVELCEQSRWRAFDSPGDEEEIIRHLLEEGEPEEALRLLRRTRWRRARSWEEEVGTRLELAARAHEALHRLRAAVRLYRKLLREQRSGSPSASRLDWEERVAALEARLRR